MRHAAALLVVLVLAMPAALGAQSASFAGAVGIISYVVPDAQASAFEQVVQRVLGVVTAPVDIQRPLPALSLRLLRAQSDRGFTVFLLVADPVVPGVDYSLPALIRERANADTAASLERALATATAGASQTLLDLQERGRVSAEDILKSRIELQLGPLTNTDDRVDDPARRDALARLRLPSWSVDRVTYEITDRRGARWRVRWVADVRNSSPLTPLSARLTVSFNDATGARLAETAPQVFQIGVLEGQQLTGEIDLDSSAAQRIASASAAVEAR